MNDRNNDSTGPLFPLMSWRPDLFWDSHRGCDDRQHVFLLGDVTVAEARERIGDAGVGHVVLHDLGWVPNIGTASVRDQEALFLCAYALHLGCEKAAEYDRATGRVRKAGFRVETSGRAGEVRLSYKLPDFTDAVGEAGYLSADDRYRLETAALEEYNGILDGHGWEVSEHASRASGHVWLIAYQP